MIWNLHVRRTDFDLPIMLFLLSAGVGVWASYQPQAAWTKFWLIVFAVLLYYAIAWLFIGNGWTIAGLLGLMGVLVSIWFLFGHDWLQNPSKIGLVNQVMVAWMEIRLFSLGIQIHPNYAAGISALACPFLGALWWKAGREKRFLKQFGSLVALGLVILVLVITTTRGAWLSMGVALACWLIWRVGNTTAGKTHLNGPTVVVIFLCLIICGFVGLLIVDPVLIKQLITWMPELGGLENRIELYQSALALIRDFPFTGGGLNGFPGLYSHYILAIPNYFLPHSHHLFFDVAIEQGILGSLALIWLLTGSLWRLLAHPAEGTQLALKWATLSGLVILIVHSLSNDILYTVPYTPLLLVLPGLAVSVLGERRQGLSFRRFGIKAGTASVFVLLILGMFNSPLRASWLANLAAVQMAQVELASFPTNQWDDGSHLANQMSIEDDFKSALQADKFNPTANYRLGLISSARRDFPNSVAFLETAYHTAPGHRGIQKYLGLCYAWNGQLPQAIHLLKQFSEASNEMQVYSWWWDQQGRPGLAENARQLVAALATEG